jgi:glutamate/tyrosine decarboxylase-like PLP-dependent enzyme
MKQSLNAPLPSAGISHPELAAKLETLLPHGVGNTHPRFFGWVHGAGAPGAVLPELVGAAMNANCGGRDHGGIYVERQVLAWSREIMGFPPDSGALLVSGTSMATVIAIKAARDRRLGFTESRTRGLTGVDGGGKLVGYVRRFSTSYSRPPSHYVVLRSLA